MKTHSKFLLVAVFVLGCFASHVAQEVAVPRPVQAQTATASGTATGAKWQYGCQFVEGPYDEDVANELTAALNTWGTAGWELATVSDRDSGAIFCFKQPL